MFDFTVTLRLCPDQDLLFPSQLFSALGDLEQDRILAFRTDMTRTVDPHHGGMILLDVRRSGASRSACVAIDIADRADHFSDLGLATADLYFKRHYVRDAVRALPESLRDKVRPFGLVMPCLSRSAAVRFFLACFKVFLCRNASSLSNLRLLKTNLLYLYGLPVPSSFSLDTNRQQNSLVVFQTRLWPPHENTRAKDVNKVNEERANMVRSLRRAFGNRFVGGIVADAFSRSFCPDVVTDAGTWRRAYIQLTQRALVGVFTRGLHDTLGFRMPEYLGVGLAIVSEPIHDELLAPLVENTHYRAYRTTDECVAACDFLMTHPEDAARMRAENFRYFLDYCDPKSQFVHLLKQSISDAVMFRGDRVT